MHTSRIIGTGAYLPEKVISNYDLEKMVETNHDWIMERTGISERRAAAEGQNTTDLAKIAADEALKNANCDPKDLDFIFFATTSPDQLMPNSASILQTKIGTGPCGALDIAAACTGFLYGLSLADMMISTGQYKKILVVGAEIITRFVNYEDRQTCILFSDGAGAAVVGRSEEGQDSKIYGHKLRCDGDLGIHLTYDVGGSKVPVSTQDIPKDDLYIKMNGKEIFKNATRTMAKCCKEVLEQTSFPPQEVDWLVPHQANLRIIESVAKLFEFPMDKVVVEIEKMGNNSAATIPISLHRAITDGRIKRGDNVLMTAFGAGLTSGGLLMRY